MKVRTLLFGAALLLPLAVAARPTLTLQSPKPLARLTNGLFTAAGTAKGTLPITGVYYSLDGSAWAPAAGTTNWSATNLTLAVGANYFWVYAQDSSGTVSLTNKVPFTYVVKLPLAVATEGQGRVSPNYAGKLLQVGRHYTITAVAAPGFRFNGWSLGEQALTTPARLSFVMGSNLSYTASFVDIARPVCAILYPAAGQRVTHSPFTALCRAHDNAAVAAIYYQLNDGNWQLNTASVDGTNWAIVNLSLQPGPNTLNAFAADAAGNCSRTNTVTFTYAPEAPLQLAPQSLSGLVATVVGAEGDNGVEPPFEMSFGLSTFAQSSTNYSTKPKVGNYTYTVLSSNAVELSTTTVSPPNAASGIPSVHAFVFTNRSTCVFTNDDASLGVIYFASASNSVPSASAHLTLRCADTNGTVSTLVLGNGTFTNYAFYGTLFELVNNWGTYTLEPFSPTAVMLQSKYRDSADAGQAGYTELTFSPDGSQGAWSSVTLSATNTVTAAGCGTFTVLNSTNPPANGYAPLSLSGTAVTVSVTGGVPFQVSFGDCTYAAFNSDTNGPSSSVGDYTYMRTGPNSGQLVLLSVEPWLASPTNAQVFQLAFDSFTNGLALSPSSTNAISLALANDVGLPELAGRTLTNSIGGSGVFGLDGQFTWTFRGQTERSPYTYAPYSPDGGMLTIYHSNGTTSFVQLQYTGLVLLNSGLVTAPPRLEWELNWYETDLDPYAAVTWMGEGTGTIR